MCALPARYSCSVTGAIGNCIKNHSHIRIFERNNQESFTSFLLTLKKNLKNIYSQSKPYIVLDNFSGHKTNKSLRVLEQHFQPLWLPPHSCQFNCIERFWSISKSHFRVHQAQNHTNLQTKSDFIAAVQLSTKLPPNTVRNIYRSNWSYLERYLA